MNRIKILGLDLYGCKETLERLDDYVDHELAPDETKKVQQHLVICRACAQKFRFETELVEGIKDKTQKIAAPVEVEDFKAKLAAALQKEKDAAQSTE